MRRYMIELSHSAGDCVQALDDVDPEAQDFLGETYWGCMAGEHTGWVVVDADSEEDAGRQVPESIRDRVRITEVQLVTPALEYAIDPEAARAGVQSPDMS